MDNFSPFTGRTEELERLGSLLEKALEYSGSTVFIRGDIGVGKSRLLRHFIDGVRHDSFYILEGRSIQGPRRPLSTITNMIEEFLRSRKHNPGWMVRHITPGTAANLLEFIPAIGELYPVEVPTSCRSEGALGPIRALLDLFLGLSRSRPVVIVLDDIQWMSPDSIDLLSSLAHRIGDLPILMIAGMRSETGNQTLERLTDELVTQRQVQVMDLENLSPPEISDLMDSKLIPPPPKPFKEWISTFTRGNPLFIEEIVKALVRQNVIHRSDTGGGWEVDEDYRDFRVPDTLDSIIRYRFEQLDEVELRTLEGAAIIGERFGPGDLRELLGDPAPGDVQKTINILTSLGMLERCGGEYDFKHPLIRHVIYSGMDVDKRRKLHRRLASILETDDRDMAAVALHLTRDLLPEEETPGLALHLFRLAMDIRNSPLDLTRAWEYMGVALRMAEKVELEQTEKLRIRAEHNYLGWSIGGDTLPYGLTDDLLRDLIEHNLKREAAITCRTLFHTALIKLELSRAEEYLSTGTALLEQGDHLYWSLRGEEPLLRRRQGLYMQSLKDSADLAEEIPRDTAPEALYKVITNMGLVCFLLGEMDKACEHVLRARELVEDYNLLLNSADSRLNLGLILMTMGRPDRAMAEFMESIREAELLHRPSSVGIGFLYLANCHFTKRETREALACLDEICRKGIDAQNPRLRLYCLRVRARICIYTDDLENAEKLIREMEIHPLSGQAEYDLCILKTLAAISREQPSEAIGRVERAISLAEKSQQNAKLGIALGFRGVARLLGGRIEGALDDLASSESHLLENGDIPLMAEIYVNFGIRLGGEQGEAILIKGIGLLRRMNASMAGLAEELEKHGGFGKALELIMEENVETSSSRVEVFTFGGLSIRKQRNLTDELQRNRGYGKPGELLGLLVVERESGMTREALAVHMWPDADEKKAQASLRVALSHLRKVVGEDAVLQEGQYVRLNRDLLTTDVWKFTVLVEEWRRLLRDGKAHTAENRALRAMELYRGDFLPEFYSLPVEDEQFMLRSQMRELLLWMAEVSMDRVEYREAVRFARRLLAMDPCSEHACRLIMRGLAAGGDMAGAVRQYMRLRTSLSSEFNTQPSAETKALYQTLVQAG